MKNDLRTEPADNTAQKQRGIPFKPGVSGNPEGRPKGSRNKLGEAFVQALADDFSAHGVVAVERVRQSDPSTYLKIIGNTLPRETLTAVFSMSANVDFSDVNEAKIYLAAYRRVRDDDRSATIDHLTPEAEMAWKVDDDD